MSVSAVLGNTCTTAFCLFLASVPVYAAGDASRGANVFQVCASCHSVKPGEQLTGPSLANVLHHKAGTVPGFARYSDAMKKANVVWNDETLDRLEQAPAQGRVVSLRHCGDTYTVKTADGKVNKVWEFNLRFKTDSSDDGPQPGKPVIIGAGMQGDRAAVVFAKPSEISRFVKESCEQS